MCTEEKVGHKQQDGEKMHLTLENVVKFQHTHTLIHKYKTDMCTKKEFLVI